MPDARWWRAFYAEERRLLGERGLARLFDLAPALELPADGALVFPHARLPRCGSQTAAVARAVLESGADTVLALGVLHGGRAADAPLVARARAGDADSRAALRSVHGPGVPGDAGRWTDEFSLDGLAAFLDLAALRAGREPPRLVARFPFLVGARADDLPGLDELVRLVADGAAVVATADHVHHGAGYGTAAPERLAREDPRAAASARADVERSFALLSEGDLGGFARHAERTRSDFRDVGPVLAALRAPWRADTLALELVPYADVLDCPEPTWVAAALTLVGPG